MDFMCSCFCLLSIPRVESRRAPRVYFNTNVRNLPHLFWYGVSRSFFLSLPLFKCISHSERPKPLLTQQMDALGVIRTNGPHIHMWWSRPFGKTMHNTRSRSTSLYTNNLTTPLSGCCSQRYQAWGKSNTQGDISRGSIRGYYFLLI